MSGFGNISGTHSGQVPGYRHPDPVCHPYDADSPRADDALNNTTIQTFNQQMQTLCQEKGWYFVNVAEALSDESGFLRSDFSGDKAMAFT